MAQSGLPLFEQVANIFGMTVQVVQVKSQNETLQIPQNVKRVVVIGGSCSGKSTFSKMLAEKLKISHVELDALNWEPNWKEAPPDIFSSRIESALTTDGWIVDGSYSKIRDLVWPHAEIVVWLDLPLTTILKRFFIRTYRRSFKNEILWSGNRESLRNSIFQKNSLLMWILKTHKRRRLQYLEYLKNPPYPQLRFFHLKSEAEVKKVLSSLN